jgi:hypothetical protein
MFARRCPTAPKPTQPSSVSICMMALFKMGMAALGGCKALVEGPSSAVETWASGNKFSV